MANANQILEKLGFSDKEVAVYKAVLAVGPAPVRKIALQAAVNRGTTYDILKALMEQGLVSYYHQEKKQYFVAEHPERLLAVLENKTAALQAAKSEVTDVIPELAGLLSRASEKPVVKYYEGDKGVRTVLQDVLATMAELPDSQRSYVVYSSADIREHLYRAFPEFTKRRIADRISVRVIALGSGGEEAALSERRWLSTKDGAPTYLLIYAQKTAIISVSAAGEPRGVILEDSGTSQTQRIIFDSLWKQASTQKS